MIFEESRTGESSVIDEVIRELEVLINFHCR